MLIPLSELKSTYNVDPTGIIHVGAHTGEELEAYIESGVSRVIWIEANPSICEYLRGRLQSYPGHQAFQFAAHERDGLTVSLNVTVNTQSSSILALGKHLNHYPEITVTEQIQVPTRTLDTFVTSEGIPMQQFNFLNLDIQGAELLVLKGFERHLKQLDYIYTEVNTDHLYEGCCLLPELDEFLGQRGFERVAIRMTSDDWGDALYRRGFDASR